MLDLLAVIYYWNFFPGNNNTVIANLKFYSPSSIFFLVKFSAYVMLSCFNCV